MARPNGNPRGTSLRRTTTLTILATLAVLLALPTGAFAVHVNSPVAVGATPVGTALAGASPAASAAVQSSGLTAATPGRVPLYESLLSRGDHAPAQTIVGPSALHGAIASLARGAGPAFGVSLACSTSSSTSASCTTASPRSASPHPSALPASMAWQNATPGAGTIDHSTVAAGQMAYDAFDHEIIYFGGCDAYACPDNQTWAYSDGYWQNLTDYLGYTATPPGVYEASMDYDYNIEQVVLFGGIDVCGTAQCLSNQTWIFSGGFWTNESGPKTCAGYGDQTCWPPSPRYGASMTFANDSSDNVTLLFGGCIALFCAYGSSQTYTWTETHGWALLTPDGEPTARAFASMAYDAVWGATILFGGCDPGCGLGDTWSFYNGQWSNETYSNYYYGFATPSGRGAAEMTYDTSLGVLFLFGGLGITGTNDIWGFQCGYYPVGSTYYACGWINDTPLMNLPGAIDLGMTPSESSSLAPVVVGGICTCTGGNETYQTYVLEPLFSGAPSLSPDPARIGQTVYFNANLSGGTTPYYGGWDTGAGYYYYYGTGYLYWYYSYTAAGRYQVNLTGYDFYGVLFYWTTAELVGNISAQISVTHASTEVGASDGFSTPAASGGTAPYTYGYSFGDGIVASDAGVSVSHSYGAAGTYHANLTVTDSIGLTNFTTVSVTVGAGPSVTVASSASQVDLGTALTFTPTATGGIGPYSYSWSLGGGATSMGTTPSYTYTTAGSYAVTVTVTDSVGGTATGGVTVVVNPSVSGTVSATPSTITVGGSVSYSAAGTGGSGTYTYTWNFGDGTKSTTATGSHTYATSGTYTAIVWINDTLSGSYTHSVTITVNAAGSTGTSSSSGGLPGWALWAAIGVVALLVIGGLLFFVVGRRRKKDPPASAMPPTGAAPPPPPGAQ